MSILLEKADDFIWRNARLLERRRYEYLFKDGSAPLVLSALKAYQNSDGGFGNALEPDKRCPESQPIDQEIALQIMDEAVADKEIISSMCDFLESITTDEGGVPTVLPSVNNYPHAPWWVADDIPAASINPTASIAGWLYKHNITTPWLDKATEYCWNIIEAITPREAHDMLCILTFLENAPDKERTKLAFDRLTPIILGSGMVAMDVDASGYTHKPLDWAPTPQSICRRWFDNDIIDGHLNALVNQQQSDGGWPITWPCVSVVNEMEWRGMVTLKALKTLKAYSYIR